MGFFYTRIGRAVKRSVAACLLAFLRLFYFLPVNGRRIFCSASGGEQYAGNVKCVSEYLQDHYGGRVELVWGFKRPGAFKDIPGIKPVRYYSPAWFYHALTAAVIITDVANARAYPKRKQQFFLDTWHGGGAYKRVGYIGTQCTDAERRSAEKSVRKIDLCLSSSRLFTQYMLHGDLGFTEEILNCGMPRNDIFFSARRREQAAKKVRQALGLEGFVALYAPTYRGETCWNYQIDYHFPYQDVLAALQERTGGPVTLLKRAHVGCTMADSSPAEVPDVSDWPDMEELLCAADMLITDYSSSIWDYALMGKPCLLYVKDLEAYVRERGICTPVERWPGVMCRSDEELVRAIRTLDEDACREKAREHLRQYGSYETGTATEQVCKRIMTHIKSDPAPCGIRI